MKSSANKVKSTERQEILYSVIYQVITFFPAFVLFYAVVIIGANFFPSWRQTIYWPALHGCLAFFIIVTALSLFYRRQPFARLLAFYRLRWTSIVGRRKVSRSARLKIAFLICLSVGAAMLGADFVEIIVLIYSGIAIMLWRSGQKYTVALVAICLLACPIAMALGGKIAANQFGIAAFSLLLTALVTELVETVSVRFS